MRVPLPPLLLYNSVYIFEFLSIGSSAHALYIFFIIFTRIFVLIYIALKSVNIVVVNSFLV